MNILIYIFFTNIMHIRDHSYNVAVSLTRLIFGYQAVKHKEWMYVTCNMNCIHQSTFRKCLENKIWNEEKQITGYTKKLKHFVQIGYHQNSVMNWVFFQMSLITSNKDTRRWKTTPLLLNYTVKILRSSCRCADIVAATILCKIHPLISFNHRFTTEWLIPSE